MIVISGALVLVALVLLIIGVVGPDLTFVYASIGVSLVSLVFLVIGILQRRGETAPAADVASAPEVAPAEDSGDRVTAVIPTQARGVAKASTARLADEPPPADDFDEELETGGTVLVVEGRPRYHVDGCRYLSGKTAEAVDVLDARDEGFTACGVCKPDEALAAAEDDEAPVVQEDVPGVQVPSPTRTAKAPAKASTTTSARTSAKAPAKAAGRVPAKAADRAPAKAPDRAVKKAPAKKAPSKAATAAVAATPAAATASQRPGSVVVIPDRGKYHRAECRYVRGVDDAEVLSKAAAGRSGYAACGVCKP